MSELELFLLMLDRCEVQHSDYEEECGAPNYPGPERARQWKASRVAAS